jgi:hypothetical protein
VELFYTIADADCATARRAVLASPLRRRVRFRNLHYAEVREDFERRGGHTMPALWDGERLHQGLDAVRAAVEASR